MTVTPKNLLAGGNVDWYQEPHPVVEVAPKWTGTVIGTQKGWSF